jgi:hypothetical protein
MKIKKIEIGATVPTGQYANIQPRIEIEDIENSEEAVATAESFIKNIYNKYSVIGPINKVVTTYVVSKKSFNEDVNIDFDRVSHTYLYKNKPLIGATAYISKFFKKFDSKVVAEQCGKAWDIEPTEIEELWQSTGELTSGLGTLIHRALEHYDLHKSMGEKISCKKKMEANYCLPKHPVLKAAILSFTQVDLVKGKIIPEAVITDVERGFCGTADRILIIDEKKKICRVQDYKINVECEKKQPENKPLPPFDDLPSTKISKYQLQLSFYANMLQKSGWTVEGLDVFVLEKEWKKFELPVLKVI